MPRSCASPVDTVRGVARTASTRWVTEANRRWSSFTLADKSDCAIRNGANFFPPLYYLRIPFGIQKHNTAVQALFCDFKFRAPFTSTLNGTERTPIYSRTHTPDNTEMEVPDEANLLLLKPELTPEERRKLFEEAYKDAKFSPEQVRAIESAKEGKNTFFTGPGGVGKSKLIKYLIDMFELLLDMEVSVVAPTGAAAVLIGGTTLHTLFGCGIPDKESVEELVKSVERNPSNAQRWKVMKVLIVDEISMVDPVFFDKVDKVIRSVRNCKQLPFGGIQLILSGDFCQIPPVITDTNPDRAKFLFQIPLWEQMDLTVIPMTTVFRQSNLDLVRSLNRMRFGVVTEQDTNLFKSRVGAVFDTSDGIAPTRLYSRVKEVQAINEAELQKLPGKVHTFHYQIVPTLLDGVKMTPEIARQFKKHEKLLKEHSMADNTIELKVGAQVILLANLDKELGLANGSKGVVEGFSSVGWPMVRFEQVNRSTSIMQKIKEEESGGWNPDGPNAPLVREITPWGWKITEKRVGWVEYRQVPLKLAWALTIHKAQGMSLNRVEISMRSIFDVGQAYVALSRITCLEALSLLEFWPNRIKADPLVKEFYLVNKCKMTGRREVVHPQYTPYRSRVEDKNPERGSGNGVGRGRGRGGGNQNSTSAPRNASTATSHTTQPPPSVGDKRKFSYLDFLNPGTLGLEVVDKRAKLDHSRGRGQGRDKGKEKEK